MAAKNEKKLCEIVIRQLEVQGSVKRAQVTHPETDGSGPPVEIRFNLEDSRFAIEHTLVEPFPESIRMASEFTEFAEGIVDALGVMPSPGRYDLTFPINPTAGLHRRRHPQVRSEIIEWVRLVSAQLHAEQPERRSRVLQPYGFRSSRDTIIAGIPLTLVRRLHWSDKTRHDGLLLLSRLVGPDIEPLRRERLSQALDKKLPKLSACSVEGDITILIVEFSDIALSNHISIAEGLERLFSDRDYGPDHIFIADTCLGQEWALFHFVENRVATMEMKWIEVLTADYSEP